MSTDLKFELTGNGIPICSAFSEIDLPHVFCFFILLSFSNRSSFSHFCLYSEFENYYFYGEVTKRENMRLFFILTGLNSAEN